MEEKSLSQSPKWVTDAVLIAASTVIAYLYAYQFETGYASVFNIPAELIELSLTSVIRAWVGILSFTIIFLWFAEVVVKPVIVVSRPLTLVLYLFDFWPLYFFVYLAWTIIHWKWPYTFLVSLPILGNLICIARGRSGKEYFEKMEDILMNSRSSIGFIISKIGKAGTLLLFMLCLGYLGTFYMGKFFANAQTVFLINFSNPNEVILSIFNDKVISAPFDRKTREIANELSVTKMSDGITTSYKYEKVGPLHMEFNLQKEMRSHPPDS